MESIKKTNISIFSPAAAGSVGHSFIYALKLCENISKNYNLKLFTIYEPKKNKIFSKHGIFVVSSKRFKSGVINKSRFNKYGVLKELIYGTYRLYYNYCLLKEFYSINKSDTYQLFEFEYFSTFLFLFFRKEKRDNTIIGLHSIDFRWIKGRSIPINLYKFCLYPLIKYLIKNTKYTTVHGTFLQKELRNLFKLNKKYYDKIVAIPYGCNIKSEPTRIKEDSRTELKINGTKKIGLFFGVLRKGKGIIELLKVLKQFNNITLLVAGSEGDVSKREITKIIKSENISDKVKLIIEYIPEEEIPKYFYASDFVFITHSSAHIAFSGPLSLAVEYNRPVIASNVGEIGHFVKENKNGILYNCGDFNDLVYKTNIFCENTSVWNGFNYHEIKVNNSWEMMAKKIMKLYSK